MLALESNSALRSHRHILSWSHLPSLSSGKFEGLPTLIQEVVLNCIQSACQGIFVDILMG